MDGTAATRERILVVDDEKLIRMTLRERLEREGFSVVEAERGAEALERLSEAEPDLMLLDFRLPDFDGLQVLRASRESNPETGVILMTAYSTVENAVEALKLGAADYLKKPVDHDELMRSIARTLETTRLRREVRRLHREQQQRFGSARIIGRSSAMRHVFATIYKVARSGAATVLIQGESGTGKDLVAKAIHYGSERADAPFVNITCSALPESLLESELFGHERGAFTGATARKQGLLELADGGTAFLDEIGDMGPTLQAKLLRFLEEKAFKRVGGVQDLRVDVRVVAATNRSLDRAVAGGAFREDLYYRLKVIPIHLPALRDRREDIGELVAFFMHQFGREMHKHLTGVSPEAVAQLMRYDWPGNIRELRNVVERAMILGTGDRIEVEDLPDGIVGFDAGDAPGRDAVARQAPEGGLRPGQLVALPADGVSLHEVEAELLRQALEVSGGNQTRAAALLRIGRDALRYKLKKHGLL